MFLVASWIFSGGAGAAVLVQEKTFGDFPNFSDTLTFDQWNNAWGTLNSIKVEMEINTSGGALRVDNDSPSGSSSTVSFGATGNISSSDVFLFNSSNQSIYVNDLDAATSGSLNLGADDGDTEVGGTSNYSNQGPDFGEINGTAQTDSSSDFVGSAWWTLGTGFIGAGTYNIDADIQQQVDLGTISGAQQQIDPLFVNGFVRVTYDYTGNGPPVQVPEPQALSFFIVAGLTLLAVSRKRV